MEGGVVLGVVIGVSVAVAITVILILVSFGILTGSQLVVG